MSEYRHGTTEYVTIPRNRLIVISVLILAIGLALGLIIGVFLGS